MWPSTSSTALAATFLTLLNPTTAHSWLENIFRIQNGQFVGSPGYVRDHQDRTFPGFDDELALWRIKGIDLPKDPLLCRPEQDIGVYSEQFPPAQANPGDFLALRYRENGHTTKKEEGRAINGGTVYVYGTTQPLPSAEERLSQVHKVWNAAGTGGDGRGRLLATRNYDDGICHEFNETPDSAERAARSGGALEVLCQTDVQIPENIPEGQYTLYWVWDWPLLDVNKIDTNNAFGTEDDSVIAAYEAYTQCMDIEVKGGGVQSLKSTEANPIQPGPPGAGVEPAGQDDALVKALNTADGAQLANSFIVTANIEELISGDGIAAPTPEQPAEDNTPELEPETPVTDVPALPVEDPSHEGDHGHGGGNAPHAPGADAPEDVPAQEPTTTLTSSHTTTTTSIESAAPAPTEEPEQDGGAGVVTVTDIAFVTLSLPSVVTQTISIGASTTTTLPIVVEPTTMETVRRPRESAAPTEGTAVEDSPAVEPEPFMRRRLGRFDRV